MESSSLTDILRSLDALHDHLPAGVVVHAADGRIISASRDAPRIYALGQLLNGELRDTNAVWFNVECAGRAIDDILRQQ